MPNPYANTGVYDQRDAITKALMNVAAPPPQSRPPQMPGYRPQMGLPNMPPQGAPSMGAPPPGALPTTMPLAPGMSPPQPSMVGTQMPGGMSTGGAAPGMQPIQQMQQNPVAGMVGYRR